MITLAFNQMFYYGAIALQKYGGEDGLQIMSTMTLADRRLQSLSLLLSRCSSPRSTLLLVGHFRVQPFGMALRAASKNEIRVVGRRRSPDLSPVAFVISGVLTGISWRRAAGRWPAIHLAGRHGMGTRRRSCRHGRARRRRRRRVGPAIGAAAFVILELVLVVDATLAPPSACWSF